MHYLAKNDPDNKTILLFDDTCNQEWCVDVISAWKKMKDAGAVVQTFFIHLHAGNRGWSEGYYSIIPQRFSVIIIIIIIIITLFCFV